MFNNAQFKGERQDQGNVASYIEGFANMIAENDGKHDYWAITSDCSDNQAPFLESQETTVHLTAGDNHDIVQLEDGFITFEIELQLKMEGLPTLVADYIDTYSVNKIFVGFKNSAELLHQLQVFNRNQNCGLQDNECLREGFAMHTISPKIAKQKKFDHSIWENVRSWSPCVAGAYVDIKEFVGGKVVPVTFEVNLPITDIMCMQAFTLYPVFCLGNLDLKFYVRRDGLVWSQCNPEDVFEKHIFFGDYPTAKLVEATQVNALKINASQIKHGFTQIGNPSRIVQTPESFNGAIPSTVKDCTLHCQSLKVVRCNSTIMGFKIQDSSKTRIQNFFQQTRYLPSQKLDYYAFPHQANQSGINSSINAPLVNCSFISFMFPRNPNDKTVFENIMYKNVQVSLRNRNYPDEPITTVGARFLQLQLVASELDGPIEPTSEYERSLTELKNRDNDERKTNSTADASSFMLNIQLERSGAGYCFDGIDTDGQNVCIQLKGDALIGGVNDTYYNYQTGIDELGVVQTGHPVPPEAWICRECYWELDIRNGMKFKDYGQPPGSQTGPYSTHSGGSGVYSQIDRSNPFGD
jgi:hypothetical protein